MKGLSAFIHSHSGGVYTNVNPDFGTRPPQDFPGPAMEGEFRLGDNDEVEIRPFAHPATSVGHRTEEYYPLGGELDNPLEFGFQQFHPGFRPRAHNDPF